MSTFEERLRDALHPDYELRECLGRGGMGAVYKAWQVGLERYVAVKVLHPDRATEVAVQRFRREARILAGLGDHANIVTVFGPGEKLGLHYYIMEYVDGQSLAERLADRTLDVDEARKVGRDILDALEAAHGRGIIHRDIKPGNVMLLPRRAVLVDFGIARTQAADGDHLTETGARLGTLSYMAPEQLAGDDVSPRTDLYAVGAVLYEALSGTTWILGEAEETGTWRRVPLLVRSVLKRALVRRPEARWPDAQTFRRRLWGTRVIPYLLRAAALTVSGVVVGALAIYLLGRGARPAPVPGLSVQVESFAYRGIESMRWLADSVTARVVLTLQAVPDVRVTEEASDGAATVALGGMVQLGERGVSINVSSSTWDGLRLPIDVTAHADAWVTAADSVATHTMRRLWSESSPLAEWLPVNALPHDPQAFGEWVEALRLDQDGRWAEAYRKLRGVIALDSSCVYCSWLITEIQRWRLEPPDTTHRRRVLERLHLFPPHYQRLIRARLATDDRLDSLEAVTRDWPDYYYGWFLLGEEKFNRGPLFGRQRAAAAEDLERAARLRPQFAPVWWDLAWIRIAEGDTAGARAALAALPEARDPMAASVAGLLEIAYAYAFRGPGAAAGALRRALADSAIGADPNTPAAPRLLPSFEQPGGAVFVGGLFAELGVAGGPRTVRLRRSGLIAQMLGWFALGQPDSTRALARVYRQENVGDAEMDLFLAELDAVNYLVDPDASRDAGGIVDALLRIANAGEPEIAGRAWWMSALVTGTGQVETGSSVLDAHLRAVEDAAVARHRAAIERLESERRYRIADSVPDPFYRTVVFFQLAQWYLAAGDSSRAVAALRYHEALDLWGGLPTESPIAQEVDWSFGTLARWRRAQILDRLGETQGEVCSAYARVARHWRDAPPPYGARAASAARRHEELRC